MWSLTAFNLKLLQVLNDLEISKPLHAPAINKFIPMWKKLSFLFLDPFEIKLEFMQHLKKYPFNSFVDIYI